MSGGALQAESLGLSVSGQPLVTGLNLVVQAGQRWCVIGRNASGKSTLLRALAGLSVPQMQGRVLLQGHAQALCDASAASRLRAYMPQQVQDRFDLSVRELLLLQGDGLLPGPPAEVTARALDVLALLDRPVTQLSGGERQRVALAAMAQQGTPLWLLDEPVSFQDPAHQRLVSQWLCGQSGKALVMSAHDMAWVQRTATHVLALVGEGRWQAGTAADVLTAETLRATFACEWRQVGGVWLAD
jgi:iron complex transport system ATP-binding protein